MKKAPTLKIKVSNNTECHICEEKIKLIADKILSGQNVIICITVENGEKHIHKLDYHNLKAMNDRYNLGLFPV
jgi:hypothetical protein